MTDPNNHEEILYKLGNYLIEITNEYISSLQKNALLQKPWFALGILKSILLHFDVVYYIHPRHRRDLIDAIETNFDKYISSLKNDDTYTEVVISLQSATEKLLKSLKERMTNFITLDLNDPEKAALVDIITVLTIKCKTLFAEQTFNTEAVEMIQGYTIALNTPNLTMREKIQLFDKLMLVKELWYVDALHFKEDSGFKLIFFLNPFQHLSELKITTLEDAFEKVTRLFVYDHNILINLSDESLTMLYDRLKNFVSQSKYIFTILDKIHYEAHLRYNYNRLSDAGYELLKRFQTFDTILSQIENIEYEVAELYLFKKNSFVEEISAILDKNVDILRLLGFAKNAKLSFVVNRVKSILKEGHSALSIIASMEEKLSRALERSTSKNYTELDEFAFNKLSSQIERLLINIENLLDDNDENDKGFLNNIIIRKFAQEYYLANQANSIAKLRAVMAERLEITKMLSEINFVSLLSNNNSNNISITNLQQKLKNVNAKSASDYVHTLIRVLAECCNATQLDLLYNSGLKGEMTTTQLMLRQEINKQVQSRTTIAKFIFSILTGKSSEFNKLRAIKKVEQL